MKKHVLLFPLAFLMATLTIATAVANTFTNDNYLAASRMHHRYTAWNSVQNHLISGKSRASHEYLGQEGCSPTLGYKSKTIWANYIGRDARYQSAFNGNEWKLTNHGVQLGTDFFRTCRFQVGGFFGYEDLSGLNRTVAGNRDRIDGKDYYVGMYGTYVFRGGADFRTVFGYGWQNHQSERTDTNSTYMMAFDGNTTELTLEIGKRQHCYMWSARPSIAVDWYESRLCGGREALFGGIGGNALLYDKTDYSQLFFRFGSDLRYEMGALTLDGGLFYSYDMLGEHLRVRTSRGMLEGSQLGRSTLSYNLGASWNVNRRFTVFGGYRGEYAPESAGQGFVNISYIGGVLRW